MKAKVLKPLLLSAAAILLVVATVLATMAYLTSTSAVSNVFTVGDVKINMYESKVDSQGKAIVPQELTDTNSYHLVPGKTYDKDPTVYVEKNCEPSYLFVRVRNDLKSIEKQGDTSHPTIVEQLKANGWYEIERASTNVDAVFVYAGPNWVTEEVRKLDSEGNEVKDENGNNVMIQAPKAKTVGGTTSQEVYPVFTKFTISNQIAVQNGSSGASLQAFGGARVAIVAYAIQASIDTTAPANSYDAYMAAWKYIKAELPFVV